VTAASPKPPERAPAARLLALHLGLPLLAGASCVLGFAPFYAWPVPIVAVALLVFAWMRSGSALQAGLSGFVFGLGYFLAGVSWVYVSLHVFGSMPAALAALATFVFCAYLALFPAAAGALAVRLAGASPVRRAAAAAASLALLEWFRGWLFTGFPWLNLGTSQVPGSPLAGFAPYLGGYGVSLAVACAGAALAVAISSRAWSRHRVLALIALAALFATGEAGFLREWTQPAGPAVRIGLLQGNVPQQIKWEEDVRSRTLVDYRRMIFATDAPIVIIPETALPAFLDQLPRDYLESLREHGRERGKDILIGTVERDTSGEPARYFNSLVRITGDTPAAYRKRHLVPFGEFIPPGFRWVLSVLRIPMSDFASGRPRQAPIVAAGVPLGVAICYEDIFGEEVIDALPQAQILVNVSNDAWFGESFAADQHLQSSQLRALETGRWMVRATNTGASAAIDERGRVVSRLPAFTAGQLVEAVVPRTGMTPYARFGNLPAVALMALLAALCAFRRP